MQDRVRTGLVAAGIVLLVVEALLVERSRLLAEGLLPASGLGLILVGARFTPGAYGRVLVALGLAAHLFLPLWLELAAPGEPPRFWWRAHLASAALLALALYWAVRPEERAGFAVRTALGVLGIVTAFTPAMGLASADGAARAALVVLLLRSGAMVLASAAMRTEDRTARRA